VTCPARAVAATLALEAIMAKDLVDDILDVFQKHEPTIEEFGAAFATVAHVLGCTDGHAEAAEDAELIAKVKASAKRAGR
jgi:hypothetical protein